MSAQVRPAQAGDAAGVFQAWEALRKHYAALDPRIVPAPVSPEEFEDAFAERLAIATSAAFVAVEEHAVVGFISGIIEQNQPDRLPERHATVGHLFVDPAHRRDGIGRKLFEALAAWARSQEVAHFEMPVLAADREAGKFWQSIGFTPFIERLWAPLSAPRAE